MKDLFQRPVIPTQYITEKGELCDVQTADGGFVVAYASNPGVYVPLGNTKLAIRIVNPKQALNFLEKILSKSDSEVSAFPHFNDFSKALINEGIKQQGIGTGLAPSQTPAGHQCPDETPRENVVGP